MTAGMESSESKHACQHKPTGLRPATKDIYPNIAKLLSNAGQAEMAINRELTAKHAAAYPFDRPPKTPKFWTSLCTAVP